MGLFEKKTCDICGAKIGLLGNRKLDDGNMCGACAKQLSPFTTDRRRTSVAQIKEHLAYREANKAAVAAFNLTRAIDGRTKVLIDEGAGTFIITTSNSWKNDNPDVIKLSQIASCSAFTRENKIEQMQTDASGNKKSYFPRRYDIRYDYSIKIVVNSPFFDEIGFELANNIDSLSRDHERYYNQMMEIKDALTVPSAGAQSAVAAAPAAVAAPEMAQPATAQAAMPSGPAVCPSCGAPAGTGKFCEFCGKALNG